MIIAALDTGMRRGERLALRFADIDWKRRVVTLRGVTTKSRRTLVVPIGTARLLAGVERLEGGKRFDLKIKAADNLSRSDRTELRRQRRPAKESATSH